MADIRFTKEHYYIVIDADVVTVGLTDYILGKIVDEINLIELPEINNLYNKSERVGGIFVGDEELELYSPVNGEIAEINETIIDEPDTIKNSNYENNWLFRIYPIDITADLENTMNEDEYNEYIENI